MLNIRFLACTRVIGPDSLYCAKWKNNFKVTPSCICGCLLYTGARGTVLLKYGEIYRGDHNQAL